MYHYRFSMVYFDICIAKHVPRRPKSPEYQAQTYCQTRAVHQRRPICQMRLNGHLSSAPVFAKTRLVYQSRPYCQTCLEHQKASLF